MSAYSYSHSAGNNTRHAYRGSGVGKFLDGIDYSFFTDRREPEMPAEVFAANRLNPSERNVRQKLSSSPGRTGSELVGWSELLMIDLVLAYFRYYAGRRTDYEGRTFCHHSQVRTSAGFVYAFLVLCSGE